MQATAATATKIGGMMKRVFTSNFPTAVILGRISLCLVLSIRLLKSISRPGIRVNTDSRLSRMALISTMAMSRPMPKCMKASAPKPEMVVRELEDISGMALLNASMQASRVGRVTCSAENRWHRMMA